MFVDLTQYMWIVWAIFILLFVIVELLTLEFTFLMIAFGSVAGLGANLMSWPWWLQIVVAAVVSVLLILIIKPLLLRTLHRDADPTPTNVAALYGMPGRVVQTVTPTGGLVKLRNGETWSARIDPSANVTTIDDDAVVEVTDIEGSIAVIVPVAPTPDSTTD